MEEKTQSISAPQGKLTGLKKRQQVIRANKKVFMWAAIAALIVTTCVVISQFFVRQLLYNNTVIGEKSKANKIVKQNIENIKTVTAKVNAMIADENLAKARANKTTDSNFQVILDALPTTGDAATLASSLAQVVLPPSNASVVNLTSGTVGGSVTVATPTTGASSTGTTQTTPQELPFTASLAGNMDQFKEALVRIERTVRPISVTKFTVSGVESTLNMSLEGKTYYQPEAKVSLGTKEIPYEKK